MKVKESVECLNLRKMEAHMVKQKKYADIDVVMHRLIWCSSKLLSWRRQRRKDG